MTVKSFMDSLGVVITLALHQSIVEMLPDSGDICAQKPAGTSSTMNKCNFCSIIFSDHLAWILLPFYALKHIFIGY